MAVSRAKVRKEEDKNRKTSASLQMILIHSKPSVRPPASISICVLCCVCALCCGVDKAELRSGACEDREVGGSAPW